MKQCFVVHGRSRSFVLLLFSSFYAISYNSYVICLDFEKGKAKIYIFKELKKADLKGC